MRGSRAMCNWSFVVLLVSLAAALYFSGPVQRLIADPIADLSQVARRIASEKNYSVRAKKRAADEIGVLIDSFNEMLSKIETHELARKEAEASLRESEERYALAARGANDGLWDWKFATNTIHISSRWSSILGERAREGQCNPEDWFQRIHPLDRDRMKAAVAAHCEQKTAELSVEYRMQHRKGHFIWVLTRGVAVRDPQGVAIRMAGSQTDITEGKVADPLTGLPNRLYFLERLENAIEEAKDGKLCAVLFLDLDRFKLVNDSLGHAAGDELLMGIAERLRLSVREASASEFAGASVVSRLSGDEFAVLLDGLNETSEAATVAQLILKQLRAPFHLNGRQMFASVSIGIATGSSGCTPEDLLRNADTAMYYAKTKGKARFEIFDDTMRERALERLEIETDLREAIQLKQLVVYYQPKVCLRTRQVTGYEALVRWNHPRRGIIGPGEFVQVAEETDLIVPLGHLVLRESCRQMAEWHARFPKDLKPTVSVNVSFKQLNDGSLVEDVRQALAETGLDPQSLTLELTESTLMANPESASDTLRSLKELGVGLEIDDFGTGYSSLSYLNRLPFDTLKIDRSFVKELAASGESSEIIRTILELARSMNMEVVAEGVETHEQLQLLCELGSTYAQGFYFSKPLGPEATLVSMQQHHDFRKAFGYLQGSMPVDPLLESLQDAQIIEPVEVSG